MKAISMGMFVSASEALIWRGPMDVEWGSLDYLILEWGSLDYLILDPDGLGAFTLKFGPEDIYVIPEWVTK
jgi:Mrp family chromosome partitioning ATPase